MVGISLAAHEWLDPRQGQSGVLSEFDRLAGRIPGAMGRVLSWRARLTRLVYRRHAAAVGWFAGPDRISSDHVYVLSKIGSDASACGRVASVSAGICGDFGRPLSICARCTGGRLRGLSPFSVCSLAEARGASTAKLPDLCRAAAARFGWQEPALLDTLARSERAMRNISLGDREALELVRQLHDYSATLEPSGGAEQETPAWR